MSLIDGFIEELRFAAPFTRNLLERVPEDRFDWKPGEKAMTLGQLAIHIATIPAGVSKMVQADFDVTGKEFVPPMPESKQQVLEAFEQSLAEAESNLRQIPEDQLSENWHIKYGDDILMELPVTTGIRNLLFNHLYHHRGQLVTYFRGLDVPVPAVFGASADENPFAAAAAAS